MGTRLGKVEEISLGMSLCFRSGQKLGSTYIVNIDGPYSNTRRSLSNTPFNVLPYVVLNTWWSVEVPDLDNPVRVTRGIGQIRA